MYRVQDIADNWANFAFNRGRLSLAHSFRWTHKLISNKFGFKKLETSPYRTVWSVLPSKTDFFQFRLVSGILTTSHGSHLLPG